MENKGRGKLKKLISSGAVKSIAAWALALCLWQGASMLPYGAILIASPVDVVVRLGQLCLQGDFWMALLNTFWRMVVGFLIGSAAGALCAALSSRSSWIKALLRPYVFVIKSVPVASFIVIALVLITSKNLSVFISFLMVFPVVYSNILQGIESSDPKMAEMAKVFELSAGKRFLYILLPHLKPHIISACSTALGLAWKAGVAAEVIGIASETIGEALYMAKVHFDTAELFAWTVVIVLLSIGFEKLFLAVLKFFFGRLERS
ncbi:MAG: ABC transporter permease subunit [Clostridia bacterium]|nr:ABC transporter permease subunit [Clostridia bacterium]